MTRAGWIQIYLWKEKMSKMPKRRLEIKSPKPKAARVFHQCDIEDLNLIYDRKGELQIADAKPKAYLVDMGL